MNVKFEGMMGTVDSYIRNFGSKINKDEMKSPKGSKNTLVPITAPNGRVVYASVPKKSSLQDAMIIVCSTVKAPLPPEYIQISSNSCKEEPRVTG